MVLWNIKLLLISLRSARGPWNLKLSELVERKLIDLEVSPSSLEQVKFLVTVSSVEHSGCKPNIFV